MDAKVGHVRRYTRATLRASLDAAGFEIRHDALRRFAGLCRPRSLFKAFDNGRGDVNRRMLRLYDRLAFPVSRALDTLTHRWFGKNLLAVASQTAPSEPRPRYASGERRGGREQRQPLDDRPIGLEQRQLAALGDRDPAQRLSLARRHLPAIAQHVPDVEPDALVGIVVHELEHGSRLEHLDAELLVELALERRERRFARLALAAGELP